MKEQAIPLGEQIIKVEQHMDDAFKNNSIDPTSLKHYVSKSAKLYSELRFVHLSTHLRMMKLLSSQQVELCNQLRGYSSADPCENIPEDHNSELWRKHNACEE
jgi:hypothetical protein